MKNILKRVSIINSMLLLLTVFTINGCSKKADVIPNSNTNTSDKWGELIAIPDITEGDFVSDPKTSNEGVYMEVDKGPTMTPWIYRLHNTSWIQHQEPLLSNWEPANETTESADDFAIFFSTSDNKNGYVNINTGLPALMQENTPYGINPLLVDNSSGANKWAYDGYREIKIQDKTNIGAYKTICTLPDGILFAEADPYDAVVWAASDKKLYKITVNGAITVFDISTYDDPSMLMDWIAKIRFPYDVLHKDVYFRYQNKVFKIANGSSLSLFYTIKNGANFLGGDFCVDNSYMYATDGTKKSLALLTETNMIPSMPTTTDQTILLDYITKTSAFALGPIEVLKDPLDRYIYGISNVYRKVLKVPKSL